MRFLVTLIRNLVSAVLVLIINLFRLLGLRAGRADWVAFDLREDPPWRRPPWRLRLTAGLTKKRLETDLHTLSRRLDELSRDRWVKGVLVRIDGLSTSLSKVQAMARLLEKLRQAGKSVVVWTGHATTREAALLFAGDQLHVSPGGRLDMKGFAIHATSAAPALDWLGLGVTVSRRGRYKTAANTLIDEEASPELRETLESILDELFEMAVGALVEGRGMSREEAVASLDRAPWTAALASSLGAADGVLYRDEVVRRLEEGEDLPQSAHGVPKKGPDERESEEQATTGALPGGPKLPQSEEEKPAAMPEQVESSEAPRKDEKPPKVKKRRARIASWQEHKASKLASLRWKPVFTSLEAVALIHVNGLLVEGDSRHGMGGKVVGHRSLAEALALVRRRRWIRGVLLHIDSRGGSAIASDAMWREIKRTASKKPVVAFMDTVAASGGYYCAAGASHVVASPYCLTGSIGVISVFIETSRLAERLGVKREVLQRGRRAAMGTSARPPTEEERLALEEEVEAFYRTFLERVAEGRSMTVEEVGQRAEGRVYTGRTAKELSLVDELGGFEEALARVKELCGLRDKRDVPLVPLDVSGPALGAVPSEEALGRGGSLSLGLTALGLDGFDLAWLQAATSSPSTAWAVLPHRLT